MTDRSSGTAFAVCAATRRSFSTAVDFARDLVLTSAGLVNELCRRVAQIRRTGLVKRVLFASVTDSYDFPLMWG